MLRLDIGVVWTILNLLVFYLLLKKFLFGPVLEIMEQRQEKIDTDIKDARDAKKDALELKSQYDKTIQSAKEESHEIIKTAQINAKVEYDKIVAKADTKAAKIIENAQKTIDLEREKTVQDVQSQIVSLAMAATEKIMKEKQAGTKETSAYEQFLQKAGESHESGIH